MAIIFMDGAEKGNIDQWTSFFYADATSVVSSAGLDMSGNYAIKLYHGGTETWAQKDLGSDGYSELYATLRYRHEYYLGRMLSFLDTAETTAIYFSDSTGYLRLIRGSTTLATGATPISTGTTYALKIYYKPLNSGGQITVYLDGVQELTYTGDTTEGLENVRYFRIHSVNYAKAEYFDDIVISTTDIAQNLRIGGKAITGAGTTTQWDASAGSNYECVDEIPPVNTDYNSTNTTNEIDTFALANITETIGSISAVQIELTCAYEGSPTPTHIRPVIRSNGTDYPSSTDKNPPSSFGAPVVHIWETDPQDNGAWTESRFNAIEIGYKATA